MPIRRASGELLFKPYEILIAVIGLAVTVFLGWNQHRLAERQTEIQELHARQAQELQERLTRQQQDFEQRLAAQQNVLQVLAVVKDYLPLLDDNGPRGKKAITIISTTATQMSVKYNDSFLADLAKAILEAPKSEEAATLQLAEATAPLPQNEASSRASFAVLASYSLYNLKDARNERERMRSIQKDYDVDIYKTQVSNHYAVTIGGRLPREEAMRLAQIARERKWSEDAFAQIDRKWQRVEEP